MTVETNTLPKSIIGIGNEWLLRRYPTLKHFEIDTEQSDPNKELQRVCPELFTFLAQNPNIQSFSINSAMFLENRQQMMGSNIKFDRLDIHMKRKSDSDFKDFKATVNDVCSLANVLLTEEFFKRLHLDTCFDCFDESSVFNISAFGNLEKLYLNSLPDNFVVPVVESIKELGVGTLGHFGSEQLAMIASNLINLKQFEIKFAELHIIKPFICHAPKLERIFVRRFYCCEELEIDDFIALDEERSHLGFAEKVTICVEEKRYMKLKWKAKKINFDFIELKCIDTCKVDRLSY